MLGEILDNAIAVFSPARAAQRVYARSQYRRLSKRAYEAATINRTNKTFVGSTQSADRAMQGKADVIRARVRDLVTDNSYARGAVDAIVANVVGTGIVPRPALDDDSRNELIYNAWNRWCEQADVTGRLHLYEMQSLAMREMIEAGECLAHYTAVTNDPIRRLPLALELIEADRMASDQDTFGRGNRNNTNEIRRGVELDRAGRAIAYWVYPTHPDGTGLSYSSPQRIDARDLLHLYRQDRIGQTRGVSWLTPAILWLRDLGLYVDNELQASAVASCFSVAIKTVDGGASFGGLVTPSDEESTDSRGDRLERLQPGIVTHLLPNESIDVINPSRPNASADAWIALILRSIAVATGLSYELISRDYSRTNYSSNRASALEDRRRFRPVQKYLVWHYCQPVYREFFKAAVVQELPGFPSITEFVSDPDAWLKVNWRPPGWEWVDPLKEAQGAKLEVESLFRSRGDVIESAGGDAREVFKELSQENKLIESLDLDPNPELTLKADAQQQKQAAAAQE